MAKKVKKMKAMKSSKAPKAAKQGKMPKVKDMGFNMSPKYPKKHFASKAKVKKMKGY